MTVQIAPSGVTVSFRGADRWWALSKGLTIPRDRLVAASVRPRNEAKAECPKLRLPGSYWPGRLHAGSYGLGDRRQLWCVHRGDRVLVIDLHGRPYSRVVVEIPNATEIAAKVNAQHA